MNVTGMILGLKHQYEHPVQYAVDMKDENIELNPMIGETIRFSFTGKIQCIACGRVIKKTYNNGYCYPCFINLAENDLCIVKPHECHFHLGTCRDPQFGERHCMIPHYVYLAQSSDVKVGITRKNNELKRWIDQGAVRAVPIAEVPTRKIAGELEFALSQNLPDKTNWRKMLKGDFEPVDLIQIRDEVFTMFPDQFEEYKIHVEQVTEIHYPIIASITKLQSFTFDKEPIIEGKLIGIKGQYVLLENGVINMKKHAGYHVNIAVG